MDCAGGSWKSTTHRGVPHFYIDVPGADDSTYDLQEHHVAIDPTFYAHL